MKRGLYAFAGDSATAKAAAWANRLDAPTTNASKVYLGLRRLVELSPSGPCGAGVPVWEKGSGAPGADGVAVAHRWGALPWPMSGSAPSRSAAAEAGDGATGAVTSVSGEEGAPVPVGAEAATGSAGADPMTAAAPAEPTASSAGSIRASTTGGAAAWGASAGAGAC